MDVRYLIIAGLIFVLGIIFTQGVITGLLDNLKFHRISSDAIPYVSHLVVWIRLFRWATVLSVLLLIYGAWFFPFHSEMWFMTVGWLLFSYLLGSQGDTVLSACKERVTESIQERSSSSLENDGSGSAQTKGQHALPAIDESLVAQAKCHNCGHSDFYTERKSTLFGKWVVDGGYILLLFSELGFSGCMILFAVHNHVKLNVPPLAAGIFGFICIAVAFIITGAVYVSPKKRIRRCANCHHIFQP